MATNLKPNSVSQHKLRRYMELKALLDEFGDLKDTIKEMLQAGIPVQEGPLFAYLSEKAGRRSPKWRDIAEQLAMQLGHDPKAWSEKIIEGTPAGKPSVSVVVINRDGVTPS